ncbi:hypothetical protein MKK64_19010 [Methylobacterium sp. E-025]|uniref:hypothetical protein n=1 Tax=Methylobacterium sp. E-025 TaxID=2836561 RepID=UPI001FBBEA71|nr:hypothetical protein [Methylobacterium sp. E-025]MCJ2113272.1 hypothetical protein [Methylobacterium sp. E-025]
MRRTREHGSARGARRIKAHTEGFESYAKRLEIPRGERDTARAAFNSEVTAVMDNRVPGRDFSPEAAATADKLRAGYKGLLELAQNPGLLDGSTRRAVKGFEDIPFDANYRPNIANHEKIDALTTRYGDDTIREFLRNAFQAANRELPDDVAEAMSKGYLKRLREATAGMTSMDRAMHGTDLEGLQRALSDLDLDDTARDAVIRAVTPKESDGGGIARSKRRTLYENTFEMQVKARDGSWETLRMKDLFHDDSHFLFNSYARQMSGQVAMSMVQVKNPLHRPAEVSKVTRRTETPLTVEERALQAVHDLGTPDAPGATMGKIHEALKGVAPEEVEQALSALRRSGKLELVQPTPKAPAGELPLAERVMARLQEGTQGGNASVSLKDMKASFPSVPMKDLTEAMRELQRRDLGVFSGLSDPKTIKKGGHIAADFGAGPVHLFNIRPNGRTYKVPVAAEAEEAAEAMLQPRAARPERKFKETVEDVETSPAEGNPYLIDGITSREDFDKLVRDMRATWDARTDLPFDKRTRLADADQKRMEFVYDRVTGIPDQFDRTTLGRGLQVVRDYNFIRVMNQVGLAQIGETLGVVTQLGIKAAMQGVPTFRAMTRDAMTGELNSAFARDMEQLSGFGADWFRDGFKGHVEDASGVLINRSAQSGAYNTAQDILHTGKRVTNVISGMAPIDTMARRWASAAIVMKILNAAEKSTGSAKVLGLNMNRMRALGLDDAMAHRVFDQIRTHSFREEVGNTGRKYVQGGFTRWDDQEALSAFRGAVWRWSREVIQENHLGQGSVLLGTAMGRTIFQFRSFMLGAYTNQFLRGLHHADFSTFATWTLTSTVGSMVYVGQQYLNTLGRADREKVLKERLSPKAIAAAWVQRGEWSSILPTVLDSGADLTGFPHLFDTRASGTASSFLGNPSIDLVNSTFKGVGGFGRAVREGSWSQPEARTAARLLPYSNALGMVPLLNTMISALAEHKPRKINRDNGLW